ISLEIYELLSNEFQTDANKKVASNELSEAKSKEKEALRVKREAEIELLLKKKEEEVKVITAASKIKEIKKVGKIELQPNKVKPKVVITNESTEPTSSKDVKTTAVEKSSLEETKKNEKSVTAATTTVKEDVKVVNEESESESDTVTTQYKKLSGLKSTGETIDLSKFKSEKKKESPPSSISKRKRRRISKPNDNAKTAQKPGQRAGQKPNFKAKNTTSTREEPSAEEVQKQVRETLEKLQGKSSKGKGAKYRKEKRDQHRQKTEDELANVEAESKLLKVTEFVTASEVATMMDVSVTEIISACMTLGMMVTMNQRLDAETLSIVAEEFGYSVEFVTADIEDSIEEISDAEEDLKPRAPIVTVMGHVDHGKTSLLDYIRKENVIAGESGGITQHIGAYSVVLSKGQKITFLDTPGHEAFTAMRARGAQVTDLAIIVIAADDDIMPQTKEAISHAQAAGVPIVFAINKIDRPTANPDKIKEGLSQMNLLVEDWGGKIQSHDISALKGDGVDDLLEKVLLEAELLELKANPDRASSGTVVEAFLDKGRGYVSTILVQTGTLKIGDYVLAGKNSGKVKAMHDERGNSVEVAGPSSPISILGLDGAPQAGDKFIVFSDEREAKQIAVKRTQLQREQSVRTQKHITLDEIGRRIALGEFKELNIILKGDVDGSVEALTDSFQKLSTEEIQVNIIHKAVGAITESDVLLASASDAIIIGFNVRPTGNARQIADKEEIDIRMYSIIYDAINDLKDAMEGMLSPDFKEEITGTSEVRETFKISKIGTIAGCMVTTGKIFRNCGVRLIRDGVVIYSGELSSLKRFKDDVKEVAKGYDCGMQIKNYNDLKEGDVIEGFQQVEIKKKLK
ncbi:translation initiation factor IF-2, partial [Bacteroidota bacterium]|nr:translation initiation factor IF-2 [Bacteroidota bacterium]